MLSRMTLEEKIGQLYLQHDSAEEALIRSGACGALLNLTDAETADRLQRVAVEESRLGIPLFLGRDVIHGYRTAFPIPLALACSWDEEISYKAAAVGASEAAVVGYNWTYSPMVDISRDARWGRIAESFGEDPLLASRLGAAMVRGYQTPQEGLPVGMAACVKHFAGYGASEGGRDYNSTLIPPRELRDIYLPPYKAAVDAGVLTVMTAFNDLDGVPSSGNRWLLTELLREEWGFDGMVVSDWKSMDEMINHGFCADEREVALRSAKAGLDMEMVGHCYINHIASLIEEGALDMATIDERVMYVLKAKYAMGLFEHPYRTKGRESVILSKEHKNAALEAACRSAVLLKNENDILPLSKGVKVAVIGPLADAPHEQIGTWCFDARDEDSVTPLVALREMLGEDNVLYAPGLSYSRDSSRDGFAAALEAARNSDAVLFFVGEESMLSGEAHSLSDIHLPGAQEELVRAVAKEGKPLVLVLMTGRPVIITDIEAEAEAILAAFHQGTMAGPALAKLLFGEVSPSGRLPVSWPVEIGQIPIYYNHKNTGRPAKPDDFVPLDKLPLAQKQSSLGFTSSYMDLQPQPAYCFGYGLSYGNFEYSDLELNTDKMRMDGAIEVSATIRNTGRREAIETVQLYVRDLVGEVTRPVRELKDYKQIALKPGESCRVSFTLLPEQLAFTGIDMERKVEPGMFKLWIAPNAQSGLEGSFELLP